MQNGGDEAIKSDRMLQRQAMRKSMRFQKKQRENIITL
jgi:hypothetical protein